MFTRHLSRLLVAMTVGTLAAGCLSSDMPNAAGSISGTVTPASAKAKVVAVFSFTTDTVGTALADTTTGAYQLLLIPPGAYTLTAVGLNLNVSKSLTLRSGQDTTGVNFQ